jgi:sugar O-acyltransferase (sialic acid O-acetyltransferase NeuD family)
MFMGDFVIWGGRGHAKVMRDLLELLGGRVAAVIDNDLSLKSPFSDVNIYYGKVGLHEFLRSAYQHKEQEVSAVVAIGGSNGRDRTSCYELMTEMGLQSKILVHPSAVIANSAVLGSGIQILGGAFVGSASKLGDFCILNSGSIVDHDCVLGRGVHIAPGAVLTGEIEVGDFSFIGANSTILPGRKIGANVIVGAGSVVTRDIPSGVTIVGSPATRILERNV